MQWIRSEWICRRVAIGQIDGRARPERSRSDACLFTFLFGVTAEAMARRFFSTAARESSAVKPRFSELPPYTRDEPPVRVLKPCTSQGICANESARSTSITGLVFALVLDLVFSFLALSFVALGFALVCTETS